MLAHELMHNLLGHLEREQGRDPARWNVAIDHATNLMLEEMNFTLPDPKCCERRFYGLTAEEIYKQLPNGRDAENWDLHLSADLKKSPGSAGSDSLSSQQKNGDSDDSRRGKQSDYAINLCGKAGGIAHVHQKGRSLEEYSEGTNSGNKVDPRQPPEFEGP